MTWEPAPETPRRPWLWPAVAAVVVVVAGVAVLVSRGGSPGQLVVEQPSRPPGALAGNQPAIDPEDLVRERLPALETITERQGDGPLLPDAPDITIVVADEQELVAIDVATGDYVSKRLLATVAVPAIDPWTLFAIGDRIIGGSGANVLELDNDLDRTVVARGFIPLPTSGDGGSIWMHAGDVPVAGAAVRLDFNDPTASSDATVSDRVILPAVANAAWGTPHGVVVSSPGGLHLATGAGVRRLTPAGTLVTATADMLAWMTCSDELVCQIAVGTYDDPDQVRIPVAADETPAYYGTNFSGFSPDGRWLAVPLFRSGPVPGAADVRVAIYDLSVGAQVASVAPRGGVGYPGVPMAWTPDSRWLLVALDDGLHAWNPESGARTLIHERSRPVSSVIVVPN